MLVLAGAIGSLPHSGAGRRWSRRTRSCHIRARDRVWAGAVVQSGVFGGGKRRWPCRRHGEGRLRGTSWRTAPLPSCGHLQTGRESYRPPFTQREAQGAGGAGVHGGSREPWRVCVWTPRTRGCRSSRSQTEGAWRQPRESRLGFISRREASMFRRLLT